MMKLDTEVDASILRRLLTDAINKPEIIPPDMLAYFVHVAQEIIKDKVVLYKRDPVENRDSWLAASIRVDMEGASMSLNPLDLPRTGADHDGDQMAIIALFTKEAQEEARTKMHPKYAQSIWTSVVSANQCPYQIKLDAATAIYAATK